MPTQAGSTIVRNISGEDGKYFDFLGRRGATLNAGQDMVVPGDLFALLADNPQKLAALNYALENDKIAILKTPDAMAQDATTDEVFRLGFDDDVPVAVPPDYGSYDPTPTPTGAVLIANEPVLFLGEYLTFTPA